jgi:hypothetical protein
MAISNIVSANPSSLLPPNTHERLNKSAISWIDTFDRVISTPFATGKVWTEARKLNWI